MGSCFFVTPANQVQRHLGARSFSEWYYTQPGIGISKKKKICFLCCMKNPDHFIFLFLKKTDNKARNLAILFFNDWKCLKIYEDIDNFPNSSTNKGCEFFLLKKVVNQCFHQWYWHFPVSSERFKHPKTFLSGDQYMCFVLKLFTLVFFVRSSPCQSFFSIKIHLKFVQILVILICDIGRL